MNSGIIGLVGGIFGIIFGALGSGFILNLAGISQIGRSPFSSSYVGLQLAIEVFLAAIIIGIISGAIPAYRASRLKPIEALRYE
jgi:putative ABC transport system permease protein